MTLEPITEKAGTTADAAQADPWRPLKDQPEATHAPSKGKATSPVAPQKEPCKSGHWPRPSKEALRTAPLHMSLYYDVRNSGVPNHCSVRRQVPSDLNCKAWDQYLIDYHDKEITQFLKFGWPVRYALELPPVPSTTNHASALCHPGAVTAFIEKELRLSAMLGPFEEPPFLPWCQTSPLMTRDKPDGTGKRVIIDLSFPEGGSVNEGIAKGEGPTYRLPTPLDLAERMLKEGKGALLWKSNLSRAYRQLRIDPLDYPLLTIKHDGAFYVDICPSFGCRASGHAQQRVSDAVVHLMNQENFQVLAYVDDFCGIAPDKTTADRSFARFHTLTEELGLKLAPEKTCPPSSTMEWLGFLFNTNDMTITIPQTKLDDVLTEAEGWLDRPHATKQQIQSLAGRLNHISLSVRPARRFMGRILQTLRQAHGQTSVPISLDFKRDVSWFCEYARATNRPILIEPKLPIFTIECDACPLGAGAFSDRLCYTVLFPEELTASHHISRLEAFNLVMAIKTLVPASMTHARVMVKTDNMGAKWALSTGRTRDSFLAACAREIWLISALRGLDILITHSPGESLVLADALSRSGFDTVMNNTARALVNQRKLSYVAPVPFHDVLTLSV